MVATCNSLYLLTEAVHLVSICSFRHKLLGKVLRSDIESLLTNLPKDGWLLLDLEVRNDVSNQVHVLYRNLADIQLGGRR